ncbi:MAG: hypothetical protein M0P12_00200 [Paludibacteraceae bacterium]|jgi:hypothetical protein|nr:hypothetical protein [Paludibacteraceae bacterium]MCK9615568.1 hypothetical protein [Candidatus Omnitrophota bacterium]
MKKEKFHPFFSYSKGCRKTAWETPEYLTEEDWVFLAGLIPFLESDDIGGARNYLFPLGENWNLTEDFFNHTIGWPEGYSYCPKIERWCKDIEKTYFYQLGFLVINKYYCKMKESLEKHLST